MDADVDWERKSEETFRFKHPLTLICLTACSFLDRSSFSHNAHARPSMLLETQARKTAYL